MSQREGRDRVLARCVACNSIHTAWTWNDGGISIVGRRTCPCGSRDLTVLTAETPTRGVAAER